MSRTNRRKDNYGRSKTEYYRDALITQQWYIAKGFRNPPTDKDIAKDVAMYGTDTKNWRRINSQGLKHHSRRERRAYEVVELQKSLKDWEYEFDEKIEPWLKRLIWSFD